MSPQFHFCGLSDIGLSRTTNQDVWTAEPHFGFFALADGMGGRKGGDVAAREALQILSESMARIFDLAMSHDAKIDILNEMRTAIEDANRWVYQMGCASEHLKGMGTTLCCLLWTQDKVFYAHVGDSRIYRFRNSALELLTRDHSLLSKWLQKKRPKTPIPPKNIITRAIGLSRAANPEIACIDHNEEDIFVLCSDGLTDAVSHEDLEKILHSHPSCDSAAEEMIHHAKKKGGGDNITVLVIEAIHKQLEKTEM